MDSSVSSTICSGQCLLPCLPEDCSGTRCILIAMVIIVAMVGVLEVSGVVGSFVGRSAGWAMIGGAAIVWGLNDICKGITRCHLGWTVIKC